MADDWLFDPSLYGEGTTTRQSHRKSDGDVEPHQPPWVLLANRSGVTGFHWPKSVDERYSTTYAICGAKGHSVVPPETMVRCSECERLRLLS